MGITWTLTGPRRWAIAALGLMLAAAPASAQTPLRGPSAFNRTGFAVGQITIPNPTPPPANLHFTYFVSGPLNPSGTFLIPSTASKPQFTGFTDQQALLPGAPSRPALNNGSLQMHIGNIASGALGDGLTMNGIMPDPDFIFSALGGGGGGGGNGGNGNGNGNGIGNGLPGNIAAVRGARNQALLAFQAQANAYQAQANWNYLNAARAATLTKAAPAYIYGPAFTAASSVVNSFGQTVAPSGDAAFHGFDRDTATSETTLTSEGSSAKP